MTSDEFNPTDWLTTMQASELTGYHPDSFRKAVKRGRLDGQKIGRDWLFRRDDVLAYVELMQELGRSKHDPTRAWAQSS